MQENNRSFNSLLPWLIWLIAALFVIFQQFIGTFFSLIAPVFQANFNIQNTQVETITTIYFLSYGIMQIPAGLILDKFNIKPVLIAALLCTSAGTLLLMLVPFYFSALLAVVLLGIGTSFAYVGAIILFIQWFKQSRFAFVLGLMAGMGNVGMAILSYFTVANSSSTSLRTMLILLTLFALLILIGILIFIRSKPSTTLTQPPTNTQSIFQSLIHVIKNRNNWLGGIYNGALFGPALAFASFWNYKYQAIYKNPSIYAAIINDMLILGLALGAPLAGYFSDKIKLRIKPAQIFATASLFFMMLIFSNYVYTPHVILIIMFCYGLFSCPIAIGFAYVKEHNYPEYRGISTGFINTILFVFIALLQFLPGHFYAHLSDYSGIASRYNSALIIFPVLILIGLSTTFFMKETHALELTEQKQSLGE